MPNRERGSDSGSAETEAGHRSSGEQTTKTFATQDSHLTSSTDSQTLRQHEYQAWVKARRYQFHVSDWVRIPPPARSFGNGFKELFSLQFFG